MKVFKAVGKLLNTVGTIAESVEDLTTLSAYYAHQSLSLACFEQDQEQEELAKELKLKKSISEEMDERIAKFKERLSK
jgi:hypothetical protein